MIKKRKVVTHQKYMRSRFMLNKWHLLVQKKKYIPQEFFFWLSCIQQFYFSQRTFFCTSSFAKRITLRNKKSFLNKENSIPYTNAKIIWQKKIAFIKKKPFFKKTAMLNHLISKKTNHNLIFLTLLSKTQFLKKLPKITLARLFLWKRMAQKKKTLAKKNKPKTSFNKQELFYRSSYRLNYRKLLYFSTGVKLTYLFEDLIRKYFTLKVKVKVCWPLSQFKNLKFYRLVYPKYKHRHKGKKTVFLKIQNKKNLVRKKYFYIGYNTRHLKFKDAKSLSSLAPNQHGKKIILSFWQKGRKKKNKYLMLKTKNVALKSEKRLSWSSKAFFTSGLITTLTLFVKYLNPQPVVDHLAKIIGGTKKHVATLKLIETILRTFHLKRGLGYRIALIGRINGANKSRTIYLRKLNRNRSRQNFSKNVNFALAHARATIGSFAIKLWVYA